ncbi:Ger(x)C family spore germination protein [Alicyclobacillus kakegawensis]|uniref:Ger(x)C family spore germination protein n=1 Tax=Alicyclobacillus kakegawensis TaxID=392012 RepID=UPI0014705DFD|nr:Ger(x)C family spore germination protein [Alicyclobacillus kakegawensis]
MRRRVLFIAVLLALVLPLSGCWDGVELQKRAIVLLLGIDPAEHGGVTVSVQIALPHKLGTITRGEGGANQGKTITVSQSGASVGEAVHRIQLAVDRRLFFGHLQAVIVNQQLARQGISPVLNPLVQSRIVPRNAWLCISFASAEQITKFNPPTDPIPARYLTNFFTNDILLDRPYEGSVGGFHQRLVTPGVEPYSFAVFADDPSSSPRIHGLAVFQGNRLVGTLSHKLVLGWTFVENQCSRTVTDFRCPEGDGRFTVNIKSVHTDIRFPTAASGFQKVQIRTRLVGDIEGGICARLQSTSRRKQLERAVSKQVQTLVRESLATSQRRWGTDIFGLGLTLYRQHPDQWPGDKQWRKQFRSLKFDIKADARLHYVQTYNV